MSVLNQIISWANTKRLHEIDLFKKYPFEVQNDVFEGLLKNARNTEWGKFYDYKSIVKKGIASYQKNVPLSYYEDLKSHIERVRKGEKKVLWNTDIEWFAKSSGTTSSKSKFIPVSAEALEECHFRGGKDIIAIYQSIYPKNNVFKGRALAIGGSQQINSFKNDIYYGDLSAVLMKNLPFWAVLYRTPNINITLMEEWEKKINLIAEKTISKNITNISGVPSWTLVLLKKVLEITGKDNIIDIWPNLELFVHGGVSFIPYKEQYKKIIRSDKMKYFETYNASEGFFGLQDEPDKSDLLLMLDLGIFYEFIPMEEIDKKKPKSITLQDVKLNKNYALVISTNAGLWRYIIGDTVKFTSLNPFKIKITGRTKHFINAFGEEVIINNAQDSLKKACEVTKAEIREYTAAPIYMSDNKTGGHQWIFEFSKEPNNLQKFTEVLDNTLKAVNSDYEAKRHKNMTLRFPEVIVAKKGLFYQWLKNKDKLGGQHKIPRLANHRKYIDELLKLNKK